MAPLVPRTTLKAQSQSAHDRLAEGLGILSIGLGLLEVLAPRTLCRMLDMEGHETLVQTYGGREIATGLAILNSHDPEPWIWARVAGDAIDVSTLLGLNGGHKPRKSNVATALVALAAVTALDVICASGLNAEKGGVSTSRKDYSARSGFPRAARLMRGAARSFQVPKDMRVPDLLRADVFEARGRKRSQSAA